MDRRRRLIVIILFLLTITLGVVAIYIGYKLSQQPDVAPDATEASVSDGQWINLCGTNPPSGNWGQHDSNSLCQGCNQSSCSGNVVWIFECDPGEESTENGGTQCTANGRPFSGDFNSNFNDDCKMYQVDVWSDTVFGSLTDFVVWRGNRFGDASCNQTPNQYSIGGRVYCQDDNSPLPGAQIDVLGDGRGNQTTDGNGSYVFSGYDEGFSPNSIEMRGTTPGLPAGAQGPFCNSNSLCSCSGGQFVSCGSLTSDFSGMDFFYTDCLDVVVTPTPSNNIPSCNSLTLSDTDYTPNQSKEITVTCTGSDPDGGNNLQRAEFFWTEEQANYCGPTPGWAALGADTSPSNVSGNTAIFSITFNTSTFGASAGENIMIVGNVHDSSGGICTGNPSGSCGTALSSCPNCNALLLAADNPTPTPSPTPTPTVTPSATPTTEPSISPSPSPTLNPSISPTPSAPMCGETCDPTGPGCTDDDICSETSPGSGSYVCVDPYCRDNPDQCVDQCTPNLPSTAIEASDLRLIAGFVLMLGGFIIYRLGLHVKMGDLFWNTGGAELLAKVSTGFEKKLKQDFEDKIQQDFEEESD